MMTPVMIAHIGYLSYKINCLLFVKNVLESYLDEMEISMKKIILICSALAVLATSGSAATRLAHITHVKDSGYQCQNSTNLLNSILMGAALGQIITGNDRGAIVGAALGSTINNQRCQRIRTVFWQAKSYGRLYRGHTMVTGNQYIGSTIYVDGLP